jgi:phage-related protein
MGPAERQLGNSEQRSQPPTEPNLVHNKNMLPKLKAVFYAQPGSEPPSQPVRDWLLRLDKAERVEIGSDIQAVQFGWPLGLPLVRHLQGELWEVRSHLTRRIARVIFAVEGNTMYLLHGFFKTTQKTPTQDLALAEKRWRQVKP